MKVDQISSPNTILILSVDDEPDFLELSKVYLEMENNQFLVNTCTSVKEALKKLEKQEFDIIISDYQMPELDGLQFLELLRKQGNNIPFIMLTGRGREEVAIEALNLGANRYIQKGNDPKSQFGVLAKAIISEVTLRRIEDAKREIDDRYRFIVENSLAGIVISDKDYRLVYVNDKFCEIFGLSREELIGIDYRSLTTIETQNQINDLVADKRSEMEIITLTGTKTLVEIVSTAIKDSSGNIKYVSQILDITDNKRIEKALRDSEEKFRTLAEKTSDWIWEVDANAKYTYSSPKVYDLLGYTPEEVIGKTPFDFMPLSDRERVSKNFEELSSFGNPIENLVNTNIHKNGQLVIIETSGVPIFDIKGELIGYRGIDRDITERIRTERELKESEERYRSFLENFQGIAFKGDSKYSQEFFLGNIEGITGYTLDDFVSGEITFPDLIHPEDSERIAQDVKAFHSSSRKSTRREYRIIGKGNVVHWLQEDITKYTDVNDGSKGVYGTIQDITERKTAEASLRESEGKYRMLVENLGEGVGIVDLNENITFCNRANEIIYGVPPGQLIGRNLSEFVTPETLQFIKKQTESRYEGITSTYEYEIIRPNSEKRQVVVTASPQYDNKGNLVGTFGITSDITERKTMEEKLKETKERYQMLVENLQEGVLLENPDGIISFVNSRIPEILGYRRDEIVGQHWSHAFTAEDLSEIQSIIEKSPKRSRRTYETKIQSKNGRTIPVMVTATPIISNANKIKGTLVVLSDITKRKEIEEREEFLFTLLRHDIGNKIHVVNSYLQLLQESEISDEEKYWVDTAIKASNESFQLMQKIELLMKIEREKDFLKITLNSLFKDVLLKSQLKVNEKGIHIDCLELPFDVKGGLLLEELFLNLIENSINHADCSKIMISGHEEKEYIVIVVEDDGKGIPKSIRSKLFTKKSKGEESTGLGIGTYLIRKIVENYGGKVKFKESELGGARFDVYLIKS